MQSAENSAGKPLALRLRKILNSETSPGVDSAGRIRQTDDLPARITRASHEEHVQAALGKDRKSLQIRDYSYVLTNHIAFADQRKQQLLNASCPPCCAA